MDFNIDMDYSVIKDQNHLNNLHKHITRTAKKYDDVRDDVFIHVAKLIDENLKILVQKKLYFLSLTNRNHHFLRK